jgi:hypothetical protein
MFRGALRQRYCFLVLGVLLLCASVARANPPEITATLITEPIVIDGALEESAWQRAQVIDTLLQREPNEGAPASERTEVRVLYSRSRLYVGVICYDSQPDAIVASRFGISAFRTVGDTPSASR